MNSVFKLSDIDSLSSYDIGIPTLTSSEEFSDLKLHDVRYGSNFDVSLYFEPVVSS